LIRLADFFRLYADEVSVVQPRFRDRATTIDFGCALKLKSNLKLFSYHGTPVFAHWSVLLAFPIALASQQSFLGALVAQAAFLVLMLAHELGHAFVARRQRLPVFSIWLYAIHGSCHHGMPRRASAEVAVAWGGVAAQAILLLLALLFAKGMSFTGGIPGALAPAFEVWIPINMLVAFCNLLPIPPLDGAKAWRFVPSAYAAAINRLKSSRRPRAKRVAPSSERVVSIESHRARKRVSNK
jgi:Zn-dependent protease